MSKGSNRRPGEGYSEGWDRVFGKGQSQSQLDDAVRKYGTYPNRVWNLQEDGSLLPADGGKPLEHQNLGDTIVLNSKEEAQRVRAFMSGDMTCKNCKHWTWSSSDCGHGRCRNPSVIQMMNGGFGSLFVTQEDFGCNRWEKKA